MQKRVTINNLILLVSAYIFIFNIFVNEFSLESLLLTFNSLLAFIFVAYIVSFFGSKVLKVYLSLEIFLTSLALFFKYQYKATITDNIILSAMLNDTSLSLEMFSTKLLFWLIFSAVLPIYFVYKVKVKKERVFSFYKRQFVNAVGVLSLLAIVLYSQGFKFRKHGQIRNPILAQSLEHFSPIDLEYSYFKALKNIKKLYKRYGNVKPPKHHYKSLENDLLVVFVIGESTRGDHFSLNGYKKNTNPKLSTIKDLISFSNAKSCDTLTINSLPCMVSPMLKSDKSRIPKYAPFTKIMHKLGYKIDIYSLQSLHIFYRYLGYDKYISKYEILSKADIAEAKDKFLLPYVLKDIKSYKSGKKLIIVHTLGSHQTYYDRFDDNYSKNFKPYCKDANVKACSRKEVINAYDNTILAIDDFLYKIINSLKSKKAILFYLSDHGESLGENGIYFHGKPLNIAPKEQFKIPWIIWVSEKYKNSVIGAKIYKALLALDKNASISHDNLYYSILGCSAIVREDGNKSSLNICRF